MAAGHARPHAVARARELIHAGFASRLDLETLAGRRGLNKFSLVRQFREVLGTTPHAYMVMLRVNRARELLAEGAAPADVAIEVGFSDQAHMTPLVPADVRRHAGGECAPGAHGAVGQFRSRRA